MKTPYFPLVWEGILIKVEFLRTWVDPQLRKTTCLPKMWQNILNKVSFESTWKYIIYWLIPLVIIRSQFVMYSNKLQQESVQTPSLHNGYPHSSISCFDPKSQKFPHATYIMLQTALLATTCLFFSNTFDIKRGHWLVVSCEICKK